MGIRILVTGSRNWTDSDAAWQALIGAIRELTPPGATPTTHPFSSMTLIHGAARGLDALAAEQARVFGMQLEPYPADWKTFGRAAGPRRNAVMVAAGAHICLAFPLGASVGTRGCMRLAERAGIRVVNYGDASP
jgi:hypothetical protein